MIRDALISDCGKYRYSLYRFWDNTKKACMFIMLNPSTADDKEDDPTIQKCIRFAKSLGYGSLYVTNLFAYRATDKSVIKKVTNPIGIDNDKYILELAKKADKIIGAWGNSGKYLNRSNHVKKLLKDNSFKLFCLHITKKGEPSHPLYLKNNLKLIQLFLRNNAIE